MSNKVRLDSTVEKNAFDIYSVDGYRGTLKELADYFNVDPISVSDKLEEGLSFSDALCVATPVNSEITERSGVKVIPENKNVPVVEESISKVKQVDHSLVEKSSDNVKHNVSDIVVDSNPLSTKSHTFVQDLGDVLVITTTTTVVYKKGV